MPSISSLFQGVAVRIVALAIVPVVVLAALTMINLERSFRLFESGIEAREVKTQRVEAMTNATEVFRDDLIFLLSSISATVQSHHRSIMSENPGLVAETMALRAQIGPTVDSLHLHVQNYKTALEGAGLIDAYGVTHGATQSTKTDIEIGEEGRKRLAIVTRLANSLPHLFGVFQEANERTIGLVQKRKFADASANFVFEEAARLRAFNQAVTRLSSNLDTLSEIASNAISARNRNSIEQSFAELGDISRDTFAFLLVFTIVLISAAIWFSVRGLTRPLQAIARATNALSAGEIDVVLPEAGRGEIGDIARSLHVFKETSATALRTKTGLDNVSVRVMIADHRGAVIYANEAACALFAGQGAEICSGEQEFATEDLIGIDVQDILRAAGVRDLSLRRLSGHELREFQKNGRVFSVAADPVRSTLGGNLGSVLLWDDITERKNEEERLRQSNEELERRVAERTASLTELNRTLETEISERTQANEALAETQAQLSTRAVQQSAVVELGRVALEGDDLSVLFEQAGALVAETLEVEYAAIFEPDPECKDLLLWSGGGWRSGLVGNASVTAGLETPTGYCFSTGETVVVEDAALEKRFADLKLFSVHHLMSGTCVAIEGHNETYGVLAAYTSDFRPILGEDIHFLMAVANVLSVAIERHRAKTAHDELTEQFHQAQKMDAIGQLAGGVAHDFNNILMTIDGYTRIAQKSPILAETAEDALERVLVATEKAAGLTNQLLVFSRKQSVDARVVEPNSILPGLDTLLRPLLGESVRLDVAPLSEKAFVETDVAQFTQALVNLAINARDAMPDGGGISISLNLFETDAEFIVKHPELLPGPYLRVDVEDHGEGIDEAMIESIFEPFFTTKEAGKGTGLGLAMVCGFVDQSKGAIDVESTVGKGTTFSIYLPTTEELAEKIPELDERVYGSKGETILLAEDDEALCDLIRRTLESLGYTVLSANDGFEALERETEYEDRIDLVLTDVVMPNLGGVELASTIRKTRPDMAVLFMSGYPSRGMAKQIDLPEDVPLVSKPCPPARLARAVRDVLDGAPLQ